MSRIKMQNLGKTVNAIPKGGDGLVEIWDGEPTGEVVSAISPAAGVGQGKWAGIGQADSGKLYIVCAEV